MAPLPIILCLVLMFAAVIVAAFVALRRDSPDSVDDFEGYHWYAWRREKTRIRSRHLIRIATYRWNRERTKEARMYWAGVFGQSPAVEAKAKREIN